MVVIIMLVAGSIVATAASVVYSIGQVSLRQTITPPHLLGRVTSLAILTSKTALPAGGLLGGLLGEFYGLRVALFTGGIGVIFSTIWLVYFRFWSIDSLEKLGIEYQSPSELLPEPPLSGSPREDQSS